MSPVGRLKLQCFSIAGRCRLAGGLVLCGFLVGRCWAISLIATDFPLLSIPH